MTEEQKLIAEQPQRGRRIEMSRDDLIQYLKDNLRLTCTTSYGGTPWVKLTLRDADGEEQILSEEMIDIPRCDHD